MAEKFDSGEDYNPLGEHVVEIPARDHGVHPIRRRSYATIGVAAFLAMAAIGITVGLVADQAHHAREEAAQREELRVGWQMLGALAANDAAQDSTAAAAQPATAPAAAPNVVIVTVPTPAPNAPQTAQPGAAPMNGAEPQPGANGAAATAAPMQTLPNVGTLAAPVVAGGVPGAALADAAQLGANTGAVQASPPTQALPTGSVPASNPVQSLPAGSVPASGGPTFPSSQMCGLSTCNTGSICCNPSCGICAAPGATCSQQAC